MISDCADRAALWLIRQLIRDRFPPADEPVTPNRAPRGKSGHFRCPSAGWIGGSGVKLTLAALGAGSWPAATIAFITVAFTLAAGYRVARTEIVIDPTNWSYATSC
jgi:hypothetical protein